MTRLESIPQSEIDAKLKEKRRRYNVSNSGSSLTLKISRSKDGRGKFCLKKIHYVSINWIQFLLKVRYIKSFVALIFACLFLGKRHRDDDWGPGNDENLQEIYGDFATNMSDRMRKRRRIVAMDGSDESDDNRRRSPSPEG